MQVRSLRWRLALLNGTLALVIVACSPAAPPTAAPTQAPAAATPAAPAPTTAPPPTAAPAATAAAPAPSPAASPTPSLAKRTAKAAAYRVDDRGRPQGSLHPFSVSVQPGPREQEFRLGFFETDVGQLGPMWRAAGWMATSVGALETGKDINTMRVSWETNGFIDGPSAGGLMTAAFLAATLGHELKQDVAFTGTINPDGSIGPVGGIQYKLEAVAKDGKKTFLIPIGQRYEIDEETGQTVDVVNKGQLAGLKVQEVADLAEAYEILTGKSLPRTQTTSRVPDLSPESYDRMRPKVLDWAAEYTDAMGRFKTVGPQVQRLFSSQVDDIDASYRKSQKELSEGAVSAAYRDVQEAVVGANALAIGARAVEILLQTSDFNAAQNAVSQGGGGSRVQALLERLKAYQPNSPDDAVLAVSAWSNALTAVALENAASRELQTAARTRQDDQRFYHLFMAAALQSTQRYVAKAAEDVLTFNFGRGRTTGKKVDPQALESWAGVLKRAAEANLSYFDSLILDQVAKEAGVRTDVVKDRFATNEFSYLISTFGASPAAMEYLEKNIGKTPALSYAQLGFALASYIASSDLVAQHYSLGATLDGDGDVVGFKRERALTAMLDVAADRAKEHIAALEKAGGDTSLPIVIFQAGRTAREGKAKDKLSALRDYWTASLYARLSTLMSQP